MSKILIPKWMTILVGMVQYKSKPINYIARKVESTTAWTYELFYEFEKKGWITQEKQGRTLTYEFTEKGLKIAKKCMSLLNEI